MRTIHMTVTGDTVTLDSSVAGVRGSGNVDKIVVGFDASWDRYAKTANWWDSRGNWAGEPRLLTADMLVDLTRNDRTYILLVPPEALRYAGTCQLVIDGYKDGGLARTVVQEFQVVAAPASAQGTEMTPTQAQQLQSQIDTLMDDLSILASNATDARDQVLGTQIDAEVARDQAQAAQVGAEAARDQAQAAQAGAEAAKGQAETARDQAQAAAVRTPYVGENGNWFVWVQSAGAYADSGVAARGDRGERGLQGQQGPQGEVGPQGEQGPKGDDGVLLDMTPGVFAMAVSQEGHLLVAVRDDEEVPPLEINQETGHLIYKISQ